MTREDLTNLILLNDVTNYYNKINFKKCNKKELEIILDNVLEEQEKIYTH